MTSHPTSGHSGYAVFGLFLPILWLVRFALNVFSKSAGLIETDEDDFAKEWAQLQIWIKGLFSGGVKLLGEHKAAPTFEKKQK